MMTQTLYKGKYADSRPTAEQIALLQKMNVKKEVIGSLDRAQAYELIRAIMVRFYDSKFQIKHQPKFEVYIKW